MGIRDTDAKFVQTMQHVNGLAKDAQKLSAQQDETIAFFREEVLLAASALYSRVPEERADPVLQNYFAKLVGSEFDAFYRHMEMTKCLPNDLEGLDGPQLTAVYLFRRRVLDSARKVYDAVPEVQADPILHKFFTDLVTGPAP